MILLYAIPVHAVEAAFWLTYAAWHVIVRVCRTIDPQERHMQP